MYTFILVYFFQFRGSYCVSGKVNLQYLGMLKVRFYLTIHHAL